MKIKILQIIALTILTAGVMIFNPATRPGEVKAQPPDPPAFPGAQGFGAGASGGRGGNVYKVTSLAASGNGSLQWALNQPGARIIVFGVSGVINGDIEIPHGDVTIAGQTAPGAGITIHGHLYTPYGSDVNNIIIRHIRIRPPDPDAEWPASQHDAIQFSTAHTIILDHVDASHGADEIIDFWGGAYNITVQWSAITYPIYDPGNGWTHPKGLINHRACIDGGSCSAVDPLGGRISVHHTLFAHARNRTPALSTGPADVRNNVIYNGREGFVHHNIVGAASTDPAAIGEFNIIGNTYIEGSSISLAPLWFDPENGSSPIPTRYWVWNNDVDDPGDFQGRVDNPFTTTGFDAEYDFYCCGIQANQFNNWGEFDFSSYPGYLPITTQDPQQAYNDVLDYAGARPRDIVNTWAVDETRNRTGAWANRRPVDWLQGLTPGTPPPDNDNDGMADSWEDTHGLDSGNGNDHSTVMVSGYTAIEEYINGLADALVPTSNSAPQTPSNPNPADGATNISVSQTLSWQSSDLNGDPISYTVAFGPIDPPPGVTTVTSPLYAPTMVTNTTYYWQITATDGLSDSVGPVWQFTTTATSGTKTYLPIILNSGGGSPPSGNAPQVAGCDVFPGDNIWNTPVDTLPVHPNSTAYVNTIGASSHVHADFGSGTWAGFPIGIPYTDVSGTQDKVNVNFTYDDESDAGPYPIPPNPPIEGDPNGSGDRHILIVDRDNCTLYELYAAHLETDGWYAGSGAFFDLNSHELRTEGWTSADAAGLPILPGLVRYDEVADGEIRHAIRFTAPQTHDSYVWPARHEASDLTGSQYPPMGQRFRLKAGFDISGFDSEMQVILQAMKTYGIILADNGSSWFISGVPDERWDNDLLHGTFDLVHGYDFEAVDVSSLMINSDSGQARQ